ncbi:MAG: CSLREA domain-containing protein [Ardenticatenaceae bacterium]|nr:CSLREA domain-containing protein [Ardenticatenaceae bacterium]
MKRKTVSLVSLVALPLVLFIFLFGLAQIAQAAPIAVTTTVDENDGCGAGTGCSLREAVATAVAGDTIVVPAGTYPLTLGEISISQDITITGAGADSTMVTAGGSSRIFNISGGVARVSDLTLANGLVAGTNNGGAVLLNGATLWLTNTIVSTNTANYGGGVYVNTNAQLYIYNTQFISNNATNATDYGGGAIYVNASSSVVYSY